MSVDNLKQKNYDDTSILDRGERMGLRERPGTLLGSSDVAGAFQTLMELVANGADEGREGFGDSIDVKIDPDNTITVIDHGRGIPMDWNKDAKGGRGEFNYILAFCKLYASGKGKNSVYSSAEGLNGIGCTATNYTSDFLNVTSCRDTATGRKKFYMEFVEGVPVGEMKVEDWDGETGTKIVYRPSRKVFTSIDFQLADVVDRFRRKAMVVPGIRINLQFKLKDMLTFFYENGIYEYVENVVEKPLNKDVIQIKASRICNDRGEKEYEYEGGVEVALSFSNHTEGFVEAYHNGAWLTAGGPTRDAVVEGVLKVFDKYAKEQGKIEPKARLKKGDVDSLVCAVLETRCPGDLSMFLHQTKARLENPELQKLALDTVQEQLTQWILTHKKEAESILDKIMSNREMREKAEVFSRNLINKMKGDTNKISASIDKLTTCSCKIPEESEIYFAEGDSAGGSLIIARDADYQAVMKLRGKIPNCLKKGIEALLNDKDGNIIVQIITALGCGIDLATSKIVRDVGKYIELSTFEKFAKFDISKLRYHKIIIATDADVDGGHITTLLLVMFYRFMPELIRQGHVYMAISPLYILTVDRDKEGKERRFYAYDEAQRDHILQQILDRKVTRNRIDIQRSKGLGENGVEVTDETIMNPKTRVLQQVEYPENEEGLYALCNSLLGTDIDSRKQLITEYFSGAQLSEY